MPAPLLRLPAELWKRVLSRSGVRVRVSARQAAAQARVLIKNDQKRLRILPSKADLVRKPVVARGEAAR
jgi:hypothetical protein